MLKKEEVISPLIGGLLEILFFINNLSVFSYIAYKIVHIHSVVVGIILHLIAAIIIGLIGIKVLEITKIEALSFWSAIVLGILFGSAVLALFSLPIHVILMPIKVTLTYIFAHIFYGVVTYVIYFILKE
ncbi:MAG: hypothetical protein L7G92_04620 [Stygiolobus sp.]|nr:hypothetical protein [Stygiolobus sp.]